MAGVERFPLTLRKTGVSGPIQQLQAADPLDSYMMGGGNEPVTVMDIPNRMILTSSQVMTTGTLYLNYFTPDRDFLATNVTFVVTTAHVLSTSTNLFRIGIHSLQGNLTDLQALLASTPSDPTLLDSTGAKTKAFSVPYQLLRGTRYAMSMLATNSIAWTTAPNVRGSTMINTAISSTITPIIAKSVVGQTDLPSGTLSTTNDQQKFVYYRLT